jgi:starch synthase
MTAALAAVPQRMRILLASAEVHPYSKTGGLADMVGAMAKALARAGHEVAVVTPLYRGIREKFPDLERLPIRLEIPLDGVKLDGDVWALRPHPGVTIYFINRPEFYFREGLYQEGDQVFPDNAERFLFLTKAVVHLARFGPPRPDVVHVHDWQVALAPLMIRHLAAWEGWGTAPRTCLTIHNLAYQGVFPPSYYALTGLPWGYFTAEGAEFYGQCNFLKAGIQFSDRITTVSPRYAREILTEEHGCALDGVLRNRQSVLTGILNGVDYEEWNTENNPHLSHPYHVDDLAGKAAQKRDLQAEFGLPQEPDTPLFATITRLTEQKGIDIQLGALEEMAEAHLQFVLLGSGSSEYERAFRTLAARYPDRIGVRIGFDYGLSHRIESGADYYLMPSRFEPCGLNQLYSLRYGTIPVVRATGGLDDSVVDASEDSEGATGIKFSKYASGALARAVRKALILYQSPTALNHYRRNAMMADFSWERAATEFSRFYQELRSM